MKGHGSTTNVRLRDVAAHAGVHPATVSRALNPETQQMVNAKTLQRVLASAQALNYRTNTIARSLRTRRSNTVGVLIPDITNPVFPRIVRGVEDTLDEAHYTSLIAYTDGRTDLIADRIDRLGQRGVDGLIVATARWRDPDLDALAADGVPIVQINRRAGNETIPSVTVDAGRGMQEAIDHISEMGHEHVAYLGAPQRLSTGRERLASFRKAMRRAGLTVNPDLVRASQAVTVEEGHRLSLALLEEHPELTTIVAGNDLMALGCYDALAETRRKCPKDVSIIGFNDMPFADRFEPPLTTIHFDQYEMGAAAAAMLLRRLRGNGDDAPVSHVELETRLVVRRSTAAVRGSRRGR
jgi:LacI family transcriptional regulator